MKKLLSIILTFVFLLTLVGCANEKDKKSENSSEKKTAVAKEYKTEKTYKANAEKQPIEAGEIEVLTEEDRAVKAEIAKYSDTRVDFRKNKQEVVDGKKYNIYFDGFNSDYDPQNVVYKNDVGDEFEYVIETGKLRHINLYSNIVEKTKDSIDIETAHKIVLELFPENRDINEYTRNIYKEDDDGYVIWYERNIGGYKTMDAFRAKVGFDGSIIYLSDLTDVFEGKNIDFDQKFIDARMQEGIKKNIGADKTVEITSPIIFVENGEIYISFTVRYDEHRRHFSIPLYNQKTGD